VIAIEHTFSQPQICNIAAQSLSVSAYGSYIFPLGWKWSAFIAYTPNLVRQNKDGFPTTNLPPETQMLVQA
jgi:hypothetical protein